MRLDAPTDRTNIDVAAVFMQEDYGKNEGDSFRSCVWISFCIIANFVLSGLDSLSLSLKYNYATYFVFKKVKSNQSHLTHLILSLMDADMAALSTIERFSRTLGPGWLLESVSACFLLFKTKKRRVSSLDFITSFFCTLSFFTTFSLLQNALV
jgi:hypothetical protein